MANFCPKCGSPVSSEMKFCAKCGAGLNGSGAEANEQITHRAVNSSKPVLSKTDQAFVDKVKGDFFSYQGRLNRQPYILRSFILSIPALIAYILIDTDEWAGIILGLAIVVGTMISTAMLGIRRAHDLDKTGWIILVSLIPAVGWLIYVYFWIVPGTNGINQYGSDPLAG